ncbi:MAG: YidC/Oxa1 family membrane protein insertase [Lachnospiraceae bacterium]
MSFLTLTKSTTFIIGPVASLLGYIMEAIFNVCAAVGIQNIGFAIIVFTVIVKLAMLPMSIKQQKFSKLNNVMMPELQAIQNKYKGKTDNASMLRQQEETKEIYEKYGTNPMGSCLQLLIQMPILFALYRVIYNIPAYVGSLKDVYMTIVHKLMAIDGYAAVEGLQTLATSNAIKVDDLGTANKLVDMMYNFDKAEWSTFQELFPSLNDTVNSALVTINHMNSFLGIDLGSSPWSQMKDCWWAVLIPILAGASQFLSVKLMETRQPASSGNNQANSMADSMKMMNTMMPLMSVFFCFSLAAGIGVYWVASSVIQTFIQLGVNAYMDKVEVNDLIEKNLVKVNKKRARQGLPPKKYTKVVVNNVVSLQEDEAERARREKEREERIKKATEMYESKGSARGQSSGSLASKAGMVKTYNEQHNKK